MATHQSVPESVVEHACPLFPRISINNPNWQKSAINPSLRVVDKDARGVEYCFHRHIGMSPGMPSPVEANGRVSCPIEGKVRNG